MNNQLNLDQINHSVNSPQFRVDICEMEGCLLGLLASSNSVESITWLSYFDLDKVVLSKTQLAKLEEFYQYYQAYDWQNEFSPEFLFAQFENLEQKIMGLKQFSSGFLFALGMKPNQFKLLSDECREFIDHLIDFSQISLESLVLDDDEESEFEELYEFTRAGVSLMMMQNLTSNKKKSKNFQNYHPSQQIH